MPECSHLNQIKITTTKTRVCEECVKMGERWVHLRLCMECGNVGCCDSSKNKHATKHFRATKHPLMRSIEPRRGVGVVLRGRDDARGSAAGRVCGRRVRGEVLRFGAKGGLELEPVSGRLSPLAKSRAKSRDLGCNRNPR